MKLFTVFILALFFLPQNVVAQRKQTTQQETKTLRYLKENNPTIYHHLLKIKQTRKRKYSALLRRMGRRHQRLIRMKRLDEKSRKLVNLQFRLEAQVELNVLKFNDANSDSEKSKIKNDIQKDLEEIFNVKHKYALKTLKELEEKVKLNKEKIKKREVNKKAIIQRRLEELTNDDLDW